MLRIEQAVFAPDETRPTAPFGIIARSDGVIEADARELAVWCPTNGALLADHAASVNFHPLPSGAYCVSQTTPAHQELDICGAEPCRTHCLLVPAEILARFANNPFALIHEIGEERFSREAVGKKTRLESISVSGGTEAVDAVLLSKLAIAPGSKKMASLVHLALNSISLALPNDSPSELIAGLLNCLPPRCRADFSFSTGLKFSSRRPFRLVTVSDDPAERSWVAHHPNVTVFECDDSESTHNMAIDDWARLIARVLSTGQICFLASRLAKQRMDVTIDDLPALGLQLLEELEGGPVASDHDIPPGPNEAAYSMAQRAHAAHHRFEKSADSAMATRPVRTSPSESLHTNSPELLEKLEHLDDLVYDAINGQPLAMRQLYAAWPKMLAELGENLLAESREEYLRYAMTVWEETEQVSGVRNPARAVQAMDVLCLLFGNAESI